MLRRAARVLVLQRADQHARVGLGYFVGYRIDERQQRAHWCPFLLINLSTALTATIFVIVVLAD